MFGFGLLRVFNNELKMTDSQQLLADYVGNGSEEAFRELVTRHLALVYSTAIRLVGGDTHLAEDVAQTVFVDLARKARTLPCDVMLGGWLHRDTCFVASKTMRSERRRQSRERHAVEMNSFQDHSESDLMQVAPILDEAINRLGAEDRTAILLRFFEQRDFRSVGKALGSNEDAARMRVNRALEKLHSLLTHRGVTLSIAALGTVLSAEAVTAAPVGLAVTISSVALAGAAAGTGTTLTLIKLMTMTKFQAVVVGAIVVAGVATPLVIQHQAKVREENQSSRQQIAQLKVDNEGPAHQVAPIPRPPAPRVEASSTTNAPVAQSPYEQLQAFLASRLAPSREEMEASVRQNRPPTLPDALSREEIGAYLQQNKRNAESLLAAYRMSHDQSYLREAATNFPNTPFVQLAVIADKVFPEEQRKWIDAFKASSPDNALAWYFSALDYFNSKQPDLAIRELAEATRRQSLDTYAAQASQAVEEMCDLAGWPPLAAKAWAPSSESASYLNSLKNMANQMMQTQQQDLTRGDAASANSLASMGMVLGNTLRAGSPMDQLVGIAIEKNILGKLDPAVKYDFLDRPVSEVLAELDRDKHAIVDALNSKEQVLPTLNETELASYFERKKLYGEVNAVLWLQSKHGPP
ncbi:MAG: sigma-70 family RNA polymerase sigma factor [Verrucomicrobiia bacterium]